jgi:hypothetical protein
LRITTEKRAYRIEKELRTRKVMCAGVGSNWDHIVPRLVYSLAGLVALQKSREVVIAV